MSPSQLDTRLDEPAILVSARTATVELLKRTHSVIPLVYAAYSAVTPRDRVHSTIYPAPLFSPPAARHGWGRERLLPIQPGGTFLGRILRTLAESGSTRWSPWSREHLDIAVLCGTTRDPLASFEVINPDPARGQLSSLLCGLNAIAQPPQAVLMTLVDVPLPAVEPWAR